MKINQKQKELIKIYLFLFALMFTIINWDTVSWVFNYRAIAGLSDQFLHPYPDSPLLVSTYEAKAAAVAYVKAAEPLKAQYPYSEKANSIEIPAINIEAPIVISASTEIRALEKDLEKGVSYYPGSPLPGENGQIIVLGHSAPWKNWPVKMQTVFTEINNLEAGQIIILNFNHTKYTYKVVSKNIVNKGQDLTPPELNGKNNILTAVSCWPPGKDVKRVVIHAELIKNTENQPTPTSLLTRLSS